MSRMSSEGPLEDCRSLDSKSIQAGVRDVFQNLLLKSWPKRRAAFVIGNRARAMAFMIPHRTFPWQGLCQRRPLKKGESANLATRIQGRVILPSR